VTGLTASDFTILLSKDTSNVSTATVPVTITEVTSGRYVASFTDNGSGTWRLVVRPTSSSHYPASWAETFDVGAGPLLGDEIDGYTPEEFLKLAGAMLLGKVSGGPGSAGALTFRAMDDSADRVVMTATSNGDRDPVALTP
jgi:hypothetical protein